MAITSYSELQTAVGNWLARADLSSRIPEFIALAEAKMNRELRALDQETKSTSFSINAEYVNVPSSFLQVRSFQTSYSGERYGLGFMPPEEMSRRYGTTDTGPPLYYCVVGGQFRFAPIPNTTYTATLTYYITIPPLASNSTNWLLTAHPDAYLYGSLLESEGFLSNDERLPTWKAGYDQAIAGITGSNNRNRYGGPGLQIRPG